MKDLKKKVLLEKETETKKETNVERMDRLFKKEIAEMREKLGFKDPENVNDYQLEMAYKQKDFYEPIIDTSSENVEKLK